MAIPRQTPILVQAALSIIAAEFLFASTGVAIRQIAHVASNEQIVFFRNLLGLVLFIPWLMRHRTLVLRTQVLHLHLLRALAGLGAMYCFFYGIVHLPLAQAMLLKLSSPLFIPLVAVFWLGERVPWQVRMAVVLGFIGVILVLSPDTSGINPAALVALGGGVLAALAKTTVHRLGHSESPALTVFYFALVGAVVSSLPLAWAWQPLGLHDYLWLTLVALLATAGQFFLTRGFGMAPAARMGVFGYSSVIFGAAWGWLLWDEVPTSMAAFGTFLVIVAGILAGRRSDAEPRLSPVPQPSSGG